jgi:hypothetical protein
MPRVVPCDDVSMDDEDVAFYRWYGPWTPLEPSEVAELFAGLTVPWWIVGGWAIDAFTGRSRAHEDVDVAFFKADLPAVLDVLQSGHCVWSNLSGTLRPLKRPEDLLEGCRQLWVRRDGGSPWLIDLAMTPHDGDTWISARDERIRMPLDEAVFEGADGIRYLRPELTLSFKLKRQRHDDVDFDAALPMLDQESRAALRAAIELLHPGHPWLERIGGSDRAAS